MGVDRTSMISRRGQLDYQDSAGLPSCLTLILRLRSCMSGRLCPDGSGALQESSAEVPGIICAALSGVDERIHEKDISELVQPGE
jgi:hypothetical protein